MEDKLTAVKAAVAVFTAALADFLGYKGVLVLVLGFMMALDYVSGTLAAKRSGTWSSTIAREGLFHKGGTILVVLVALVMDALLAIAFPSIPLIGTDVPSPGIFLPLVAAWYTLTEIGSILENAAQMGAKVPRWFLKAIEKAGKIVDKAGDEAAELGQNDAEDGAPGSEDQE